MSHRARDEETTFFFKFPNDVPLVVSGRPVRDLDLESRVAVALRNEFESDNASWRPKTTVREGYVSSGWRGFRPFWVTLRCYVAVVLSHLAAFSLGSFLRARGE